jgi:hypothetical protein
LKEEQVKKIVNDVMLVSDSDIITEEDIEESPAKI